MNTLVSVRTKIVYAKKKKQDEKAEDESIKDLSKRVNDTYLDFNKYRAERIARTETNTVVNEANLEAYRQADAEGKDISEMSLFKDKKKRLEYYNYYNKAIDNQTEN